MPRYDLESLVRIAKSELGNRKLSKEEKSNIILLNSDLKNTSSQIVSICAGSIFAFVTIRLQNLF